ncbi:unnamed protein product [Blepharisma stoltei]|uniref:SF-assemblin n=1 Tax=Blepharisma stoltei TaxID=1481888 RepID=A0AAU9IM04_9CILI|nr:unnamed protein product [Blepharisma stoltei]
MANKIIETTLINFIQFKQKFCKMDTYTPNLTGTVKITADNRDRREEFKDQMNELGNDYEDMLRAREETKKQLEAKFQDVYRKIQSTRDYVNAEEKRANDMLKAFKSKFEFQLKELRDFTNSKLDEERALRKEMETRNRDRLNKIQETINNEKEERKNYLENLINPVREQYDSLLMFYEREKTERIEGEKQILEKLDDLIFKMTCRLDDEVTDKLMELGKIRDQTRKEMRTQDKNLEKNQQLAFDFMKDMRSGIEAEVTSRLSHQDEIGDNISNFVKTFQDTLKVLSLES